MRHFKRHIGPPSGDRSSFSIKHFHDHFKQREKGAYDDLAFALEATGFTWIVKALNVAILLHNIELPQTDQAPIFRSPSVYEAEGALQPVKEGRMQKREVFVYSPDGASRCSSYSVVSGYAALERDGYADLEWSFLREECNKRGK